MFSLGDWCTIMFLNFLFHVKNILTGENEYKGLILWD